MLASLVLASLVSATPAVRPEKWWLDTFDRHQAYATNNLDAKVAFVGDSITACWEREGKSVWNELFAAGKYKAVPLGISGDRTEHVLWRLLNGQIGNLKPKAFVLMIGTNNNGHRPAAEETPIDTIYAIRRIVEVMRCHWPETKVILHPIFPRGAKTNDVFRIRNEKVNAEIKYLADGERVFWCDFNAKFLTADGSLAPGVMSDGLHPAEKGMRIWAENLLPTLDYALGYSDRKPAGCVPAPKPAGKAYEPRMSAWIDYRIGPKRGEIEAQADKRVDAVWLGDSITHMWEERALAVQREYLGKYEILNFGFSGDLTQDILWDCENGLLDNYVTDYVSIMIGTNNRRDSAEDVAKGIEAIVKSVRRRQPRAKILLFNIFPCGQKPDAKERLKAVAVNTLIRKLDDGRSVKYVELWNEFLNPDGTLSPAVMNDFLHPTAEGYAIWARKLAELMSVRPAIVR